jgi:hypothetical protein
MKETGSSAFPVQAMVHPNSNEIIYGENGMTLRDYFAGQALAGICASYAGVDAIYKFSLDVDDAYRYADAMIAERVRS